MNVTILNNVLQDIRLERIRQERLKAGGKFRYDCADPVGYTPAEKLAVLAEEFGEVARHISGLVNEENGLNQYELKKELIQVAAVAVAWCEAIDRELTEPIPFIPLIAHY